LLGAFSGSAFAANLVPNGNLESRYTLCRVTPRPLICHLPAYWQGEVVRNVNGATWSSSGYTGVGGAYLQIISKYTANGYVELYQANNGTSGPLYIALSGSNTFSIDTKCTTPLNLRLIYPVTGALPSRSQLLLTSSTSTGWINQTGKFIVPTGYTRAYVSLYIGASADGIPGTCTLDNVTITHP
jgi:hypothetical protein